MDGVPLPAIVGAAILLSASGGCEAGPVSGAGDPPDPTGPGGDWELVFRDEFDGRSPAALDTSVWTPHPWWGSPSQGRLHAYNPALGENVRLEGGWLVLEADTTDRVSRDGRMMDYSSGFVGSYGRFSFTYGAAEVRAAVAPGKGLQSSFWMAPEGLFRTSHHVVPPEIDVFEVRGQDAGDRAWFFLVWGDTLETSVERVPKDGLDWTEPHVHTLLWEPGLVEWWVDGERVHRQRDRGKIPQEPMYLMLQLAVGGDWPGPPDSDGLFPESFEIDYVRVWKRR